MISGNPFSAEHPAPPERFAGREEPRRTFAQHLAGTIAGRPTNVAVIGDWGVGKTSLLRVYRHEAEAEGCAATIVELDEATDSLVALFEAITRSLARDAAHLKKLDTTARERLESLSLSVHYGANHCTVAERRRMMPNLVRFRIDLQTIERQIDAPFVVMIDNAEQLLRIPGAVIELRNAFQQVQQRDGLRAMAVLAGRHVRFAESILLDDPLARYFEPVELEAFTLDETAEALAKPLRGTAVRFCEGCAERIQQISAGHPYLVQVIAYNLWARRSSNEIAPDEVDGQYSAILAFLGRRLFEGLYLRLTENERKVVEAFVAADADTLTNTEIEALCSVRSLNRYLKDLTEAEHPVIVKVDRGRYRLFHPLFKAYLAEMDTAQKPRGARRSSAPATRDPR